MFVCSNVLPHCSSPGECKCLYHLLGACVASVKLGVTTAWQSGGEKITAQMWGLGMCTGAPLLDDNTGWPPIFNR